MREACVVHPELRELVLVWQADADLQRQFPLQTVEDLRRAVEWALLEGVQRGGALDELAPELANVDWTRISSPAYSDVDVTVHLATLRRFPLSFVKCAESLAEGLQSGGVRVECHWLDSAADLANFASLGADELLHVTGQCDVQDLLRSPPQNWILTIHGAAPFSMPPHLHAPPGDDLLSLRRHSVAVPKVICPTFVARREIATAYGLDQTRIEPISHCFSHERFTPHGEAARRDTPYFLAVSNYQPKKNYITMLEAFAAYAAGPAAKANLVIAGSLNDELDGLLRDSVERWPALKGRVSAMDHVVNVAPLYRGAVALIGLSHQETYGMPYIEAALCGCPVIGPRRSRAVAAWASQSTCEILSDAGLYADPLEPNHLALLMAAVEREPRRREDMARRCRRRALEYTDPDYLLARYRHVYGAVVKAAS